MTQLIENKPRRRALIATLSHFSRSRRALQPLVSRLQRQESNRNNPRLEAYLTPVKSMRAAVLIATNDDLTKVVVLPKRGRPSPRLGELGGSVRRESKELSRDCDPLFSASTSLLTPMAQPCRSRFRGALELRYPLNLLGPGRICRDGEDKC